LLRRYRWRFGRLRRRRVRLPVGRYGRTAAKNVDVAGVSDADLATAVADVLSPAESDDRRQAKLADWDPVELLSSLSVGGKGLRRDGSPGS
jgi:hypothetical protein